MKLSLFLTCALFTFSLLGAENLPTPGDEVDLAPFGHMRTWDGNPGVEWDESRDVRRIEVDFVDEREIPSADSLHLEYWVSQWPPVLRGGWTPTDDPWQGEWRAVMASREVRRKTLVYRFLPLTEEENPNARNVPDFRPTFRRMLKFRVRFVGRPGTKTGFRVYGSSRWNMREINVQTGCEGRPGFEAGVTAYNGIIIGSTPLQAEPRGLRFKVLYTEHAPSSHDRTILTIRGGSYAFGVSVNDVIRRKAVYVMPLGVFVGDAAVGENFASWQASGNFRAAEDVISRIARQPEQTLDRAMGEIPALAFTARSGRHPYRYIPLGFPSSREKYGLDFNGNIFINKRSVKAMKEDLGRMLWKGDEIYFRLGTGSVPDFRERELAARQTLLEEYLPIVTTTWQNGEVEYTEEVYVTMLDAPLDDARLRGDEPTLLYMKLSARNPASRPAEAQVWLHVSPAERLELSKGMLLGTGNESGPYARARLRVALEAEAETLELHDLPPAASHTGKAVLWTGSIPARGSRVLYLKIPFRTLETAVDQDRVRNARFPLRLEETVSYWKKATSEGMRISVPDEELNIFFRSVLQHILVSIQRDVSTGLDICPCGTYDYNIFANETFMQVRLLDQRGLHDVAQRCLRPVVEMQGSRPFPGRFKDGSAIFHGVRMDADHDYTHSGYNLNHGWALWTMAEHYFFTRDRNWLESVLPRMLKGANWIIEERKATMQRGPDGGPVPEYGLLPAGQLEDNEEWQYWFAVNAYAYRGLKAAAEAVSEVDLAEGTRLRKEASAYREDLRKAALRAMAISPVVPLRDGTYVPTIATRTSLHGRDLGWIRNILYGAHALVDCRVFTPEEEITTWILHDYEDNLFMSEESFAVPDRDWFSRGGMTLQPNLVNTIVSYLERDQVPQALRAFYNTFAVSYFPDVKAFTEWVPTFGIGGGPFYKTSDEAGFLTWLRLMLIRESGDRLYLNSGVPRAWFLPGRTIEVSQAATFFGEVGFKIESRIEQGFIQATVSLPTRRRPRETFLRVRHPEGNRMVRVELNGEAWDGFDAEREMISLPPTEGQIILRAYYE